MTRGERGQAQALESASRILEQISVGFLDAIGEGLLTFDDDGCLTAANAAACRLFDIPLEGLSALRIGDLLPGVDLPLHGRRLREVHAGSHVLPPGRAKPVRGRRSDGGLLSLLVNVTRVEAGGFEGFAAVVIDVSGMSGALDHLEDMALRDELTGLANSRSFFGHLDALIGSGHDKELAVVVIGLADFALVNEALGHAFGDLVLHEIAGRLRQVVGPGACIARIEGARFGIALTDVRSVQAAVSLAEELLWSVNGGEVVLGDRRIMPRGFAGVAWAAGEIREAQGLLHAADLALRQTRQASGGERRVGVYNPEMARRSRDLLHIETLLMGALERNEFSLVYQPKVLLPSHRPSGVEALLRWQPPGRPPVPPDLFIRIAEQNGLIVPIGNWVLAQTTRFAATHMPAPLRMSVNMSTVQLRDGGLLDSIDAALHASKLQPGRLELEITETAAMSELSLAVDTIQAMREIGVRTAIDDFGTGYSSLSYLTRLDVDMVKIDQSLLPRDGDTRMWAVLDAIIELCHAAQREVLAEGIELGHQADRLARGGCDKGQGYFFARPMGPEALRAYLHAQMG